MEVYIVFFYFFAFGLLHDYDIVNDSKEHGLDIVSAHG